MRFLKKLLPFFAGTAMLASLASATSVTLAPVAVQQFFDNNGYPCVGCELFIYNAGTTTKATTYTNAAGDVPNTNPIILDTRGDAFFWLPAGNYKYVLALSTAGDPPTSSIWTVDQINAAQSIVATEASLAGMLTAGLPVGTTVTRLDYAAGYGAPPLIYSLQTGTCAANSMVNDGGSCVNSPDGNSWAAHPPGYWDWREFGVHTAASDNQTNAQAAVDAAFNSGLPVNICGAGTFKTSVVYFHPTPTEFCSHLTVLQRVAGNAEVMHLTDAPGHTYPQNAMINMRLIRPTIDMNAALINTTGGGGIVVSGVNNWQIEDPNIWNIPTNLTTAPAVSGAPRGTFQYIDQTGTGWAENGGIVLLGGPILNVENGTITGGWSGNYGLSGSGAPYFNTCGNTLGAAGLVLSIPSQSIPTGVGQNPPNANTFYNTLYDCSTIGVRNDYGSANRFVNIDTTGSTIAGVAIGTFGRYDVVVGGSPSGTSTVAITMMANGLNGSSPVVISYTGTGTAATIAAALVASINSETHLQGIGVTAGVWPGSSVVHIDYGDEFSATNVNDPPFNIGFCASNTSAPTCSGVMTLSAYHGTATGQAATWNSVINMSSENSGVFVSVGANAGDYIIDNTQQSEGTNYIVLHNHAGPSGSVNPFVRTNTAQNATSPGTSITASGNANCANDTQPYYVNTNAGAVTLTLDGTSEYGTTCTFVDSGGTGGGGFWATNPLTVQAPSGWGNITVGGTTSQMYNTNSSQTSLTYYGVLNNDASPPGNNRGGDWVGGGGPASAGKIANAFPSPPAGTTSTAAYVMMGLGSSCAITPGATGRISFNINGIASNNSGGDGASYKLAEGTGTAPINGAVAAGSIISGALSSGSSTAPFSLTGVKQLAVGTAYWFDIQLEALTGGTASVSGLTCSASELR